MNILIYDINYAPELTGVGKYTGEMGAWLAKQGHSVRVITAMPYYPEWAVHKRYKGKLWFTESRGEKQELELMIESARCKDVKLLTVGSGGVKARLQLLIKKIRIDQRKF